MQVGKQIQHYRKEKNLSQDDLAEIIFVSRQIGRASCRERV